MQVSEGMALHVKTAEAGKKKAKKAKKAEGTKAKKVARKVTPTKADARRTVTPSPKPRSAGGSVFSPVIEALLTADDGEWQRSGHTSLGRTVLRTVDGVPELGTLIGWIPERVEEAAQWRVRAESGRETNLDSAAMEAAVAAFNDSFEAPKAEEWHTVGHAFIGCAARRSILIDGAVGGYADAVVVSWLPPEVADFVSEATGKPAALWRIRYTSAPLTDDVEDLEEHEVS